MLYACLCALFRECYTIAVSEICCTQTPPNDAKPYVKLRLEWVKKQAKEVLLPEGEPFSLIKSSSILMDLMGQLSINMTNAFDLLIFLE